MAHAAHFITPGSHLVAATGAYGDDVQYVATDPHITVNATKFGDKVAFVRPDGAVVLLISNTTEKQRSVTLGVATPARRLWRATLPSHSLSTFVVPRD